MADITIHCDEPIGRIKPLHGLNNGPVGYGSLVDVSAYYKQLDVPCVRIHDPNWPHPREVDIPQIFPDFEADPADPASYDFRRTDDYLQSIVDTGAQIVYRLGTSIEHTKRKYYVHPPKDFAKWADICIGVIRHYNQGWADGFHHGIRYWEIWNEPDGAPNTPPERRAMWSGTSQQYFELYKTAATAIKRFDPSLKVGGFAATMGNPDFTRRFMDYCATEKLPLDLFTWHTYTDQPAQLVANALTVRSMLDERGYTATESHCNEWNYAWWDSESTGVFGAHNEYATQRLFERMRGVDGASFDAAVLIAAQDCPVDVMNFYDGAPTSYWSLFNWYGVPQKNYYAFKAFRELLNTPQRLQIERDVRAGCLYALAGAGDSSRDTALLVSNFDGEDREYELCFAGLPAERGVIETSVLDEGHNLDLIHAQEWQGKMAEARLFLGRHTVTLLKLKG